MNQDQFDEMVISIINGLEETVILENELSRTKVYLDKKYAYIDDIKVNFNYFQLLPSKLSILLPNFFTVMSDNIVKIKYPTLSNSNLVYSNPETTISLVFSATELETTNEQIEERKLSYQEKMLKHLYISRLIDSESFEMQNRNSNFISYLEFLTIALDTVIYNCMFFLCIDNRLCIGSFNCQEIDMYDWQDVVKSMLKKLEIT